MQAIILAGGAGTRLRPYTISFPKPLVPVGDMPILEIIVRQLQRSGFDDLVIATGHLAELIEAYFRDGGRWGVRIRYVREERPLGTAGALRLVEEMAEHALVMNGDILTDLDFAALYRFHVTHAAAATIGACQRRHEIDFGENDSLASYTEKPVHAFWVSMGVNVVSRAARAVIAEGEALGIPDLMLRLQRAGQRVLCHRFDGFWLDIGRPSDYAQAQEEFERAPGRFVAPPTALVTPAPSPPAGQGERG
jgi:NDP-sugar pyrophosphorylase family protein